MQSSTQITLALDTSASPLLVAAQAGEKHFFRRRKGIKQERLLFPTVHAVLKSAGAGLTNVKRIFIVRGPGRFTGIRIALTFASMLRYLNRATVRGATLFEVLRYQAEHSRRYQTWKKTHPAGRMAVVLHAFREEYFLQFFDGEKAFPAQWLSREELLAQCAASAEPLFVVGSGKEGETLRDLLGDGYMLADARDCHVRPETLLALAQEPRFEENALEPLYLKPARFELVTPK